MQWWVNFGIWFGKFLCTPPSFQEARWWVLQSQLCRPGDCLFSGCWNIIALPGKWYIEVNMTICIIYIYYIKYKLHFLLILSFLSPTYYKKWSNIAGEIPELEVLLMGNSDCQIAAGTRRLDRNHSFRSPKQPEGSEIFLRRLGMIWVKNWLPMKQNCSFLVLAFLKKSFFFRILGSLKISSCLESSPKATWFTFHIRRYRQMVVCWLLEVPTIFEPF